MRSVSLTIVPRVDRLLLAVVEAVPRWHPEHATFRPFPVYGWLIRHPDGPIVVDSGVGIGHSLIDEWYRPRITPIGEALGAVEIEVDEVVGLALSHLHFDHCGQQDAFDCPVYVQAAEHDAAQAEGYTVPEWAATPNNRLCVVDGDAHIAEGVRLLATPGHTPGHQSVLIEAGAERVVLAAQCAFSAAELRSGVPARSNLHDESWEGSARESLRLIQALAPVTCHLSHDPDVTVIRS